MGKQCWDLGNTKNNTYVVHDAFHRRGDGFEPSVRVLGKPRDAFAVVHAVGRVRVEISAVASFRGAHLPIPRGVLVVVVHTKQERVRSLEWKLKTRHFANHGGAHCDDVGSLSGSETTELEGGAETRVGEEMARRRQRAHEAVARHRESTFGTFRWFEFFSSRLKVALSVPFFFQI